MPAATGSHFFNVSRAPFLVPDAACNALAARSTRFSSSVPASTAKGPLTSSVSTSAGSASR